MILRAKKISFKKPLFLLATVSAFALSAVTGYSADERDQPGSLSRSVEGLSDRQQRLIQAVIDGNVGEVEDLFIDGEDENVQEPTRRKNSLLHLAIQGKKPEHKEILDFLLKVNCNTSVQNRFGETPIHEAASIGDKDMLDRLLEEETARVNIQDKDGNTAFHVAISKKKLECVSSFMAANTKGFDPTLRNRKGFTVGDLLDQQVQGAIGNVDYVKELKTKLLRVFNISVQGILQKEVPITPLVHDLATNIIQQNKKFFLSYCWSRDYSTKAMVDDFERFIKGLGITNYYRDVRQEEGMGMTLGTHIEDFMKNAKDSDAVVIFLNDAYLKSRNCMYEFLQIWDMDTRKVKPHAFIIRHPDFHGLFGGPRAALPYVDHWRKEYQKLEDVKGADAADRKEFLAEMTLLTAMESSISSIIKELAAHIQVNYQDQRSKGFEDILRRTLTDGSDNPAAAVNEAPLSPHKAVAGKESPTASEQREEEHIRQLEQAAIGVQQAKSADKLRAKELQEAEAIKREAEEARKRIEDLEKQLAESKKREDERLRTQKQETAAQQAEGADKLRAKELQEAEAKKREDEGRQQFLQKAAQAQNAAETEEKDPAEKGPETPLAARGHEATYVRFLNGTLIYTPARGSKVTLPIAKLANPLGGVFDLSQCGDAGKYVRIATGFRTEVKNDRMVEIWFAPRFLIEKELNTSAGHFKRIFGKWNERNAVGIFWSSSEDDLEAFDFLMSQSMEKLGATNLYDKWCRRDGRMLNSLRGRYGDVRLMEQSFMFRL